MLAVLLTSPQQVCNFPVYGEVTRKRVWWILGNTGGFSELFRWHVVRSTLETESSRDAASQVWATLS